MSTMNPYDKMNMIEQANYDAVRRSRKRLAVTLVSTVILIVLVSIVAVYAVRLNNTKAPDTSTGPQDQHSGGTSAAVKASIKSVCDGTLYPESCYSSLISMVNGTKIDPQTLFHMSLEIAMKEVSTASRRLDELSNGTLDKKSQQALESCKSLLALSYDRLNDSTTSTNLTSRELVEDFQTYLSAALTYQDACLHGFDNSSAEIRSKVKSYLTNSTQFSSNSLAILTQISDFIRTVNLRRRLLQLDANGGFPSWVSTGKRRLLQSKDLRLTANLVVAKDGTGKFTTVADAMNAVPENSPTRTVIYVKEGTYNETVSVGYSKWNVVLVGDGIGYTVLTYSHNQVEGSAMPTTGTLVVSGRGFVAMNMTISNLAGPLAQQALAALVNSDKSVFYGCRFEGFQSTLYTLALRQFYRECDIMGTVDFIFGNAAAVFQKCNLIPRKPLEGYDVTLTAQAKSDPNMNTGYSIHACSVIPVPFENLTSAKIYLGTNWKDYSTVVVMKSYLSSVLNPVGWLSWTLTTDPPKTVFFGEFENTGPGADMAGRVNWTRKLNPKEASQFTVEAFLGGGSWIPATGVPSYGGL